MYLDMRKKLEDYMALQASNAQNNVKIYSEVYNYNMIGKPGAKSMPESSPHITKIIFNNPATIVMWSDGSKTVVKAVKDDIFDPEKGVAMAIVKKALGNTGRYYNEIKKWLHE